MTKTPMDIMGDAHARLREVSVEEFDEMIENHDDLLIVDVREEEEYRRGHIPGARRLPPDLLQGVPDDARRSQAEQFLGGRRKTCVLCGRDGSDSAVAARTLQQRHRPLAATGFRAGHGIGRPGRDRTSRLCLCTGFTGFSPPWHGICKITPVPRARRATILSGTNRIFRMEPPSSVKAVTTDTAPAAGNSVVPAIRRLFTAARRLHEREKARIREGIAQIPGLMALLMKPRNGLKWTRAERAELRRQLRGLSRLSIYLVLATLPFTSLSLPLVAWWLDRRQQRRV